MPCGFTSAVAAVAHRDSKNDMARILFMVLF